MPQIIPSGCYADRSGAADDAGPITRRAIEVVKLAAAIKANPAVLEEWGGYEKRLERWKARNQGTKPKPLRPKIPVTDPLVTQLVESWAIISDTDVHFTHEYFISPPWDRQSDGKFLSYFNSDQRTIESAIIHLLGAHMRILRVLNECFDGQFSNNAEWRKLVDEISTIAKPYVQKFERGPGARC